MSLRIFPFKPEDALELVLQPAQTISWYERRKLAQQCAAAGHAFTFRDNNRVLFCGGAVELHSGHAQLWGLFATGKRGAIHKLYRATRDFIAGLPHVRVDAAVDDTAAAMRWAELVGLTFDVRLAQAAPGGGDLLIYRRAV